MREADESHRTAKSQLSMLGVLIMLTLAAACSKAPAPTSPELKELVERAAIQDLFSEYYAQFGANSQHNFMAYFTADGRLEVNGLVAKGIDEIKAMYVQAGAGGEEKATKDEGPVPKGASEMMYTNLKIQLQGDKAVATLLWHSVKSDLLTSAPKVTEYGRERTELVKQNGRWLIGRRVVLTEGGMPEGLLKSYPKS